MILMVTLQSMSTSAKEAIFGQGLVTYSASVGQIGSLNYPTSNNFYSDKNIKLI